jgi:IS30 family transposase
MLQRLHDSGCSYSDIALRIGKHRTSISRELRRNVWNSEYFAGRADSIARARRIATKPHPKRDDDVLMRRVEEKICLYWSPEQVSGWLKKEHPNDKRWHISHETIYQHVYQRISEGVPLRTYLRQGERKRRKRLTRADGRGTIPGRVFIDERPHEVAAKKRYGDWEGDTIEGAGKQGYVGTFVERKSLFLLAFLMAHKRSDLMAKKTARAFSGIPAKLRKTVTLDSGKEFAAHNAIAKKTGMAVYFAHPYHSWERGINENTNGLLRQFLPKRMSLKNLHHRTLNKYISLLNNRPRKTLGYRTPHEVFFAQRCSRQI